MLHQLYFALIEAIKGAELPGTIPHFDLWNEQIAYIEQEKPFEIPACFIEFLPIDWNSMGTHTRQSAEVTFRLHIVTRWNPNEPSELSLPSSIFNKLHGLRLPMCAGAVGRKSSTVSHSHEDLIDSIETYSVQVWEG